MEGVVWAVGQDNGGGVGGGIHCPACSVEQEDGEEQDQADHADCDDG